MDKKVKLCFKCRHFYRNEKCKICSESKKLCKRERCTYCENKSFASHIRSKFISSEIKKLSTNRISKFSNRKLTFDCQLCKNKFTISPYDIEVDKKWCTSCFTISQKLLRNIYPNLTLQRMNKKFKLHITDIMSLDYIPPFLKEDWSSECKYEDGIFILCISQDYIIGCNLDDNNEEWQIKIEQEINSICCSSNEEGLINFIF